MLLRKVRNKRITYQVCSALRQENPQSGLFIR